MAELPAEVAADLPHRVLVRLSLRVSGWREIAGGTNNRLFRVETEQGRPLLAKLYHSDRWNRQEREFGTLTALHERGVTGVPTPFFSVDGLDYAVYSFERGEARRPAELSPAHLRRLGEFALLLHGIEPRGPIAELPVTISPTLSVARQLGRIEERLAAFEQAASDPEAPAGVHALAEELLLHERLVPLVERSIADLSPSELHQELPHEARRLTSGDFGAHNVLVDVDGTVTVLDWEWAGWDDPAQLVMGFAAHGGSEGLSAAAASAFLEAYAAGAGLSAAEIARFERLGLLLDIEWVATYASALSAEVLATRRFAVAGFDADAYVATVGEQIRARLARATAGRGYRLPRAASTP
ncbi:MAG TPA: aminoglycoside phosphotransferase family protein [Dehalococcoidia bacterium]|jgi:Ser/Thr protein kinase RdoA (MazF antagonist)